MLHALFDDKPWFEPKRFGYGSGLPIAWQGWLLLAVHVATLIGTTLALLREPVAMTTAGLAVALAPLTIYSRHTRGGWKWRNGSRD